MSQLTIAIIAYKSEYFKLALESIIRQSLKDFVLLILDDSPEYAIRSITEKYQNDKRMRYIKNDTNIGQASNYLKAVELCQTEFIWIFHDDDIAEPTLAELEMEFLNEHSDVDMVSCNYNVIDGHGVCSERTDIYFNTFNYKNYKNYSIYDKCELIRLRHKGLYLPTPAKMFRTKVLKKIDKNIFYINRPCFDVCLEFQINIQSKAALLEDVLLNYRIHENQDSQKNKIELCKGLIYDVMPIVRNHLTVDEANEVEVQYQNNLIANLSKRLNDSIDCSNVDYISECSRYIRISNNISKQIELELLISFVKRMCIIKKYIIDKGNDKYIIWGASNAGIITYELLKERFPELTALFFIDRFKNGELMGIPIIHPDEFKFNKDCYILIATTPGAYDAYQIMEQKNYSEIEDYCFGYGFVT